MLPRSIVLIVSTYFLCILSVLVQIVNEWKRSSAVVRVRDYPSQQTADEITDSADDKLFDCFA